MTEQLHFDFSLSCIGGGNGNPLQCSWLENPVDRGAWWAAIYGVAQSQTWLKRLSSSSSSRRSCWFAILNQCMPVMDAERPGFLIEESKSFWSVMWPVFEDVHLPCLHDPPEAVYTFLSTVEIVCRTSLVRICLPEGSVLKTTHLFQL